MADRTQHMDLDQVKELIDLMLANDLTELSVKDGDKQVALRRGVSGNLVSVAPPPQMQSTAAPLPAGNQQGEAANSDLIEIRSPMVGTFYAASSPESAPFVEVGSEIGPETVVCIVEAMKVMNEIKAETKGTIAKILVSNREAIEYDQPLFLVDPP